MSKVPVERRSHPRRARSFELRGLADDGLEVARMTASDLSLGGLYCTSTADFPEMTRLRVRLLLPAGRGVGQMDELDLSAVVVRRTEIANGCCGSSRYRLALFFPSLDESQRSRLTRFLES